MTVNHDQPREGLERRLLSAIRQRDAWKTKSEYHYACACAYVATLEHEYSELFLHAEHGMPAVKDVLARIAGRLEPERIT